MVHDILSVIPTHKCKICGALWRQYPTHWTLRSEKAGVCCDNVPMGDQIEPIVIELPIVSLEINSVKI